MAKEIRSATQLRVLFESRIIDCCPDAVGMPLVVIVRTEDDGSNWSAEHSGHPPEVIAAIERELPALQAKYDLNPPGREDDNERRA